MFEHRQNRHASVLNKLAADKLRDKLLLKVHFRAIAKFGQLKDRKLAAMRTVNQYLHEKRAKRLIAILRSNLQHIQSKEQKMRQACQFTLFRKPVIMQQAVLQGLKLNVTW